MLGLLEVLGSMEVLDLVGFGSIVVGFGWEFDGVRVGLLGLVGFW